MMAQDSHDSGDPQRTFSPRVADQLAKAVQEYEPGSPESEEAMRTAIGSAAAEAHEREMQPQDLIIALKAVESAALQATPVSGRSREQLKTLVLKRMLTAYFGDPGRST